MESKSPSPVDVKVGLMIRMHRKARGLTQDALAENLGISYQQVQKYEKGANRVGASRLQKIAEVLGVSVSDLFASPHPGHCSIKDAPTGISDLMKFVYTQNGIRLYRAFSRIADPKVRQRIVNLVRALGEDGR